MIIKSRMIQKYFILAVLTLIAFLILGFYFNNVLMKSLAPNREMIPPVFIAKIVDRINPLDKKKAIEELEQWQGDFRPHELLLVAEDGAVIFPEGRKLDLQWPLVEKPQAPYEYKKIHQSEKPPGPPPGPFGLGPGGPPHGEQSPVLIRLSGEPVQYLYMRPGHPERGGPPPDMDGKPSRFVPLFGVFSLVLSLLLGVGAAISMIYYSVNKKVKLADEVISELQKGNLKARFPVLRKDEFGQAMLRFNTMADEIEKLVENLKTVELARIRLLQDLAHDLRTPVASLKSLLETLDLKGDQLDEKVRKEFLTLSRREVDYFARLVEDLLFLAQVSEPRYSNKQDKVLLTDLLSEEAHNVSLRYAGVQLRRDGATVPVSFLGDPQLIRRLIRNALENAFSFAKASVRISLETINSSEILIVVEDDGPGLSTEALKAFGERRISRQLVDDKNGRLSIGLGSVVMKAIVNAHRGTLNVSNRLGPEGQVLGARLEIHFRV